MLESDLLVESGWKSISLCFLPSIQRRESLTSQPEFQLPVRYYGFFFYCTLVGECTDRPSSQAYDTQITANGQSSKYNRVPVCGAHSCSNCIIHFESGKTTPAQPRHYPTRAKRMNERKQLIKQSRSRLAEGNHIPPVGRSRFLHAERGEGSCLLSSGCGALRRASVG